MEEGRIAFKIVAGKPTGKRPLGMPRRRWEDYQNELYRNRNQYKKLG